MSNKPVPESSYVSRIAASRSATIAAVFLAFHIVTLFWRPNPMWGIDFLFYMPAPIQGIFILLSILLFIPGFRRQIRSMVDALPLALWGEGRRVWLTRGLLVLVALGAFFVLSSARHFLGDGYYLLNELDAGTGKKPLRAPFTFTLIRALHYTSHAVWETAENTYRVYSYASGLLYVLLAFATAGTLGKKPLQKSIVLAFLLTTGTMQLFFGYVENYALYMPGFLLYILIGLAGARKANDPVRPRTASRVAAGSAPGFRRIGTVPALPRVPGLSRTTRKSPVQEKRGSRLGNPLLRST